MVYAGWRSRSGSSGANVVYGSAGGNGRSSSMSFAAQPGSDALTVRVASGRASAVIEAIRSSGWSSSSGT